MIARVVKLLRSDSIQATAWLGMGGVAFATANLVLAGSLEPADFGRLVLVQALASVAIGLAPLGMDQLAVRRELPARWGSIRGVMASAAPVALVFGVGTSAWYSLPAVAAVLVTGMCLAGGVAAVCASFERSLVRVNRAMLITQTPHVVFAAGALAMRLGQSQDWRIGAAALAAGHVASVSIGLLAFSAIHAASPLRRAAWSRDERRRAWRTALTFVGIAASVYVLSQLERLLLPRLLSLTELATFSVAATLVGSPYKLLGNGIGYALVPRLRIASDARERRRLIRAELVLALLIGVGGGAALVVVAGPALRFLYGTKYPITPGLAAAIAGAGVVSLLYGAVSSAVYALGEGKHLSWFNGLGWAATASAVVGAVALSRFGLVGVVVGTSLGWVVRLGGAYLLLGPALDRSG